MASYGCDYNICSTEQYMERYITRMGKLHRKLIFMYKFYQYKC